MTDGGRTDGESAVDAKAFDQDGPGRRDSTLAGLRIDGLALFLAVQTGAFLAAPPYAAAEFASTTSGPVSVALGIVVGALIAALAVRVAGRRFVAVVFVGAFSLAIGMLGVVFLGAVAGGVSGLVTVVVLVVRPTRWVRNAVGVGAGISIAAALGATLAPLWVLGLFVALGIYDRRATRSGSMERLVRDLGDHSLPAVLTLPERPSDRTAVSGDRSDAWRLGVGDAVLPAVLVASARVAEPGPGPGLPALGALVGGGCGLVVLSVRSTPDRSYAGTIPIAAGAAIGYLCGVVLTGSSIGVLH
jgi:presenilin-like A22 family membrane protease